MQHDYFIPHHGVGVRGAPGERVAQVEELPVRELEGGQTVRRLGVALQPLLVGDLGDAQPALVGDVLAQSHVPVHRHGRRHPERRVLLPRRDRWSSFTIRSVAKTLTY